jgi:hypothetical protein
MAKAFPYRRRSGTIAACDLVMTTRLTYNVVQAEGGYLARCEELSVESIGTSPDVAVRALRKAIVQRLTSVEAVAPPSRPPPPPQLELLPLKPSAPPEPERTVDSAPLDRRSATSRHG